MSYLEEFKTVDLILSSSAETRSVDAFALTLIKTERQIRKLFTYTIFQFPSFSEADITQLRAILAKNNGIYFKHFEDRFNSISAYSTNDLIGADYEKLRGIINKATEYRNKIFHGQLTETGLSREELLGIVKDLRSWCNALANGATKNIGYDGFARNSFQKSKNNSLHKQFKSQLTNISEYEEFIKSGEISKT